MRRNKQKRNRDILDGSDVQQESLLMFLFLAPGRIFLWFGYMFPKSGYKNVRMSSRHARSPLMTKAISLMFWVMLIVVISSRILDYIGSLL